MRLPRLVEPTTAELRLLRPSSLALWRALIRRRDRAGLGEGEWFPASLRDLARLAAVAYSTAKAALGELRRAGLVATSRCSRSRWYRDRETGVLTTGNAYEENLYCAAGTLRSRSGVDAIEFPARAWRAYVAAEALERVEAWRAELPRAEWRKGWSEALVAELRSSPNGRARLSRASSTSDNKEEYLTPLTETSKKAADAADSSSSEIVELAGLDDDDERLASDHGMTVIGGSTAPPLPKPTGKLHYLPPDQYAKPPLLVLYVSPEQIPELKAREVVDGFRRAVAAVYGIEWWHYSKGDIRRAKHYDKLLACGVQLAEHSVPAEHWAIWRLRWFKSSVRAFSDKPPPVWMVMSGKTVSERAGWFRKDYDLPMPTLQWDPIISEQYLRNREARQRWRGLEGAAVWYFQFPKWYVDKREEEISQGLVMPHDNWPTKPGSKYGKSNR